MKIDVSKIVKAEGASQEISVEISIDKMEFNGQVFLFSEPFKVNGTVKNNGGNLYLDASVKAVFNVECSRCLKVIGAELNFDVSESYTQKEIDPDSVFLPIVSNAIDIKSAVEDNFCTSVPFVFLCSEGCKGLCHTCGKDLNEGECDCKNDDIDPRLAGLKAFLKND